MEKVYRIQECRKAAGFRSARAAAEALGMSVGTYTAYEQERREMSVTVAWKIADGFGCTIDDLVGRIDYAVVKIDGGEK